jgi:hypothetical protein
MPLSACGLIAGCHPPTLPVNSGISSLLFSHIDLLVFNVQFDPLKQNSVLFSERINVQPAFTLPFFQTKKNRENIPVPWFDVSAVRYAALPCSGITSAPAFSLSR